MFSNFSVFSSRISYFDLRWSLSRLLRVSLGIKAVMSLLKTTDVNLLQQNGSF